MRERERERERERKKKFRGVIVCERSLKTYEKEDDSRCATVYEFRI